jgi:hypothetical protein
MTKNRLIPNRGQDLVEFALIFPFLAIIIFGIIDLGRATYYYSALQNAAREGARYAIVHPDVTLGVINRVKERAIGINSSGSDFVVGLGADIEDSSDDWSDCDFVQVQINYTFKLATPLVGAFFENGRASMAASSTMQREKWGPGTGCP